MTIDYNRYVGLPWDEKGVSFEGINCWGLIVLFYRTELGIILPDYHNEYDSAVSRQSYEVFRRETDANFRLVDTVKLHDVYVFKTGSVAQHVGLAIPDNLMIHIQKDQTSTAERPKSSEWKPKLAGIYRHKTLD